MLYVIYFDLNRDYLIGIRKKIIAQINVFKKVFGQVYYTCYAGQMFYLINGEDIIEKELAVTRKDCNQILCKWIMEYNITRTYIRYNLANKWFLDFLKFQKEKKIKTVLEIPTYPYDGEEWRKREAEDDYYRMQIQQYIYCCTTYSNVEKICCIPCIPLINGVDIAEHKVKRVVHKETDDIVLIAVATMRREHGYERIIHGMYEYYRLGGKRKVYFNLVGDGAQIPYYKQLVKEYNLEGYVLFHGFLYGKELDKVYDDSDIGIGALGLYKSGISEGTGIKAVEYCVRGLPIIVPDDYGFKNKYFVYKVPNNDTFISMNSVIDFYNNLQSSDYISDCHNYAADNYSWDKVLEPIIEYLKTN